MGGMGLDTPPPPEDAGDGMPPMDDGSGMGDEPDMNGEPGMDGEMPGEGGEPGMDDGQDPMPNDPNALSAGGGDDDDISSMYQQLSSDQQKAAEKYIESMLNNGNDQPDMQQPMESRFNFKRLIDEAFMDIASGDKPTAFTSMTRPEVRSVKEADTLIDPFSPR